MIEAEYILTTNENEDPHKMIDFDEGIIHDLLKRAAHPTQASLREFLCQVKDFRKLGGLPYLVSDCGRIIRLYSEGDEVRQAEYNGYLHARLNYFGKNRTVAVHRIVMSAFFGDRPEMFVNHVNGIKSDNSLWNLEWVTNYQNSKHATALGLSRVKSMGRVMFSDRDIKEIILLKELGYTLKEIGSIFNVSFATVGKIIQREKAGDHEWFTKNS